jgi:integrase
MAKDRSGYVFQDKAGAWYARTTITDATGKRRNIKRRAKSKREAKEILRAILSSLETDGSDAIAVSRRTFNEWADFYAAHYCKPAEYLDGKKIAGLRDVGRSKSCLVRFRAFFGTRKLRDITYRDLRNYYTARLKDQTHYKRPPTIATMNRELGILRRMFNVALREGWITKSPFNAGESLISPASERRRERILTLDDERRLLNACASSSLKELRTLVICLLDTGARLSEILKHLRWHSVSFESRTITLEAMTTKTLRERQVVMTERLFQELQMIWKSSVKIEGERVFQASTRQARFALAAACRLAKVEYGSPFGITFHSLRHTAATRLVKGQMPLQMVGRILGHSQPQTTYRYLSADTETATQAAAIFDALRVSYDANVAANELAN